MKGNFKMKNNIFTSIEPLDYHKINSDSSRHLRYHDYKHLKGVDFNHENENKLLANISLLLAIIGLTLVLFLN